MRIAAMILGILGSIWVFLEALLVSSLFSAGGDEDKAGMAGVGLIIGIGGLVAASLAMAFPLFSAIVFLLCGLLGYGIAGAGYGNHWVYGTLYIVLAVMAFFGWRGKKSAARAALAEKQRQQERDDRLESLLAQQHTAAVAASPYDTRCPSCGKVTQRGSAFCASCGAPVSTAPVAAMDAAARAETKTDTGFFDGIAQNRPS